MQLAKVAINSIKATIPATRVDMNPPSVGRSSDGVSVDSVTGNVFEKVCRVRMSGGCGTPVDSIIECVVMIKCLWVENAGAWG